MSKPAIPFNVPALVGRELENLKEALSSRKLSGDGPFTKRCHQWLESTLGTHKALLTHSCTAALEMSALLADVGPGDEIILPSFTFVSTANAIVLRGATPVFVDIRPDTLNLNEALVEDAITPRTRAVFAVHYAGVGCEMDTLREICERRSLLLFEDAAQALGASYRGRALGTLGHLGSLSFHETKNVVAGEGGALLINDERFVVRAEILREKGTNRSLFFRGQVDKYTWVDVGSSYLPNELTAAVLLAQLESTAELTRARLALWDRYHSGLATLDRVRRPIVPPHCEHNAHLYYVLTASLEERTELLAFLKTCGVSSLFHYVPLHSAPAGVKFGRTQGSMSVTDASSERLARLPLYPEMTIADVDRVVAAVREFYASR